jgi:WD40 repeat protein
MLLFACPAQAQLRGHGGPVRALAISGDGKTAVSGSFDSSAILWSLTRDTAEQVLRFHESAVNAVAIAPGSRIVTGGEDGRIVLWRPGSPAPQRVFEGHTAPVVSIAVSPDGKTLASASWDHTVRQWPLARFQAEWVPVSRPDCAPFNTKSAVGRKNRCPLLLTALCRACTPSARVPIKAYRSAVLPFPGLPYAVRPPPWDTCPGLQPRTDDQASRGRGL